MDIFSYENAWIRYRMPLFTPGAVWGTFYYGCARFIWRLVDCSQRHPLTAMITLGIVMHILLGSLIRLQYEGLRSNVTCLMSPNLWRHVTRHESTKQLCIPFPATSASSERTSQLTIFGSQNVLGTLVFGSQNVLKNVPFWVARKVFLT